MDALDAVLRANDVVAVLGRDVKVRLVNVSSSGCLLQTESRLVEGTTGLARVLFEGVEYVDDVRVMRWQPSNSGDQWFQVGVQFLWTSYPGERSLRRVIAFLQSSALKAG